MTEPSTSQLQGWIERANAGDAAARDQLLAHACDRLRRLAHHMLKDFRRVRRWEDTDDVLQNTVVRLLRALEGVRPASAAEFFRLAARQVRRELIDLARHHYGPQGPGARHDTDPPRQDEAATPLADRQPADSSDGPGHLTSWGEFHERAQALPAEERDVFDLLWYQGLTQAEAAAALGVADITVRRRWLRARLLLQDTFPGGAVT
jgi:RNA polymerase sigma-70 factor (ECF subfamily)